MKPVIALLSSLLFLLAAGGLQAARHTAMDDITKQYNIACGEELRQLAQATLKQNPHRMLAYEDNAKTMQLFNALAVSRYRDRDSHVSFHGVKNGNGSCDLSVTESYLLQTTCADARNEIFSKWAFQGRLNTRTMVLKSPGMSGKQAFLSTQFTTLCLVTTRQVISISAAP